LTNLSEYDLDYPFRLLLEAEGHQTFDRHTHHGPAEKGKDIVTYCPSEEKFYVIQMKAGNITRGEWVNMEGQLKELVELPPLHPKYNENKPTQPIWATTGEIAPYIAQNMDIKNKQYRSEGKPEILTWTHSDLLAKFHDHFFDILCDNEEFVIRFISLLVNLESEGTNAEETIEFFEDYFSGKFTGSVRHIKKVLATSLLMEMQILERYHRNHDLDTSIDHLLIFSTQLVHHILKNKIESEEYKGSYSLLLDMIVNLLIRLKDILIAFAENTHPLKVRSGDPSEIFQYPIRTTSSVAKLCLLFALASPSEEYIDQVKKLIPDLVNKNPTFCNILTEAQQSQIAAVLTTLENIGDRKCYEDILSQVISRHCSFHVQNAIGLPDPYKPMSYIVSHFLGVPPEKIKKEEHHLSSYMLPLLIKFAIDYDMRQQVGDNWKIISKMRCHEFCPSKEEDLYQYRSNAGNMILFQFPINGSWEKLKDELSNSKLQIDTPFLDAHPEFIWILILAFPWRMNWRFVERMRRNLDSKEKLNSVAKD